MSKVIIIGSTSFIAQSIINRCKTLKKDYVTVSRSHDSSDYFLDLENSNFGELDYISNNDIVIFLAAISSPDICESNFTNSFNINVINTISYIRAALKRGAKVVFFSSDVIYGSINTENNEICEDINIRNSYALMKLSVEKYFSSDDNFKIFRLSYVFSWNDKFMKYLHSNYKSNTVAEIYHPFYRKMVYINDLVDALFNLIINWNFFNPSSFNICGNSFYSRLDIVELYNNFIGLIKFKIVEPNPKFYKARQEKIDINTINLNTLLSKDATTIEQAFLNEKKLYE